MIIKIKKDFAVRILKHGPHNFPMQETPGATPANMGSLVALVKQMVEAIEFACPRGISFIHHDFSDTDDWVFSPTPHDVEIKYSALNEVHIALARGRFYIRSNGFGLTLAYIANNELHRIADEPILRLAGIHSGQLPCNRDEIPEDLAHKNLCRALEGNVEFPKWHRLP